ncbi:esterase/lipase/thioesterase domain-containing protein [Heterostelium album PN500]|uniref:Esterase/lipase/thioesterase domain-containing protein n=1 Tax=Heterostelium pallidum (strain ATCC 26659 / Pp 5 / PN500) TaxID=670386 RepID=D3BJG1_HETP5|nr:esterase/lipase/thioesterase domain-containing protein [Heterostelium album PN500]EFA78041.1 esterase/lipase/thioesterase domain-containing protein [Heterostelium album PN500]|eukprot:XP_020430168.1 esterase/lipase/thioesterase domain-containing protein [Heterostelium album PN500]
MSDESQSTKSTTTTTMGNSLSYDRSKSIGNNFADDDVDKTQQVDTTTSNTNKNNKNKFEQNENEEKQQSQQQSQEQEESPVKQQIYKKTKKESYRSFKTLQEFGYFYNDEGQLRSIDNPNDKFKFIDQEHYEIFGDFIAQHVQLLMKTEFNLDEIAIPLKETEEDNIDLNINHRELHNENRKDPNTAHSNIFLSQDFYTNSKLMIIICGSGQVRAGQWARSLYQRLNQQQTTQTTTQDEIDEDSTQPSSSNY